MTIGTLVLLLIAAGVCLWIVNAYIPMDDKIKKILNVVVVVIVVVLVLSAFGVFDAFRGTRVPRLDG